MTSDKQTAANRLNAQKSTGPRTAAGKARSAQNSRKHRFCVSVFTVAHLEDSEEIVQLRQDAIDVYHPANAQELWAVERIALCQMSLIRVSRLEAGLLTCCFDQALASDGQLIQPMKAPLNERTPGLRSSDITMGQVDNFSIAESFIRVTQKPHTWLLFLRYQAQAERLYRRAIQELDRLRALRPDLEEEEITEIPDEPISPTQPESNQPDPSSEVDPIPISGARTPACRVETHLDTSSPSLDTGAAAPPSAPATFDTLVPV